jgi:hypothetical protein
VLRFDVAHASIASCQITGNAGVVGFLCTASTRRCLETGQTRYMRGLTHAWGLAEVLLDSRYLRRACSGKGGGGQEEEEERRSYAGVPRLASSESMRCVSAVGTLFAWFVFRWTWSWSPWLLGTGCASVLELKEEEEGNYRSAAMV